jgi:hypothetical protein
MLSSSKRAVDSTAYGMAGAADKVKLIVNYGGELRRCPVSGMLRYIGGENLLVGIGLSERLAGLRSRLAARSGYPDVRIRYATVEEGLDKLHDVESDGDVWRLLTVLYYRAAGVAINDDCGRVGAFLLPAGDGNAPSTVACMRQRASSPALRHAISELDTGSMSTTTTSSQRSSNTCANNANSRGASSLQRAQSAGSALFHNATKKIDLAMRRAYIGFEAEAMVAAAAEQQKFSSATKVDEATTITRANSGLEPRAAITSEQRNPSSSAKKSSSGGSTDASRACSRIEAVAAQHSMLVARPAPVIFVPPPPGVAVLYYYPVIPV